ncbi:MAG: hypothetical protein Q9191_005642, partial [Dirinaria sp. TL-2023a]
MSFRFSKTMVGHGFTPLLTRPTLSRAVPMFVRLNPAFTANMSCKSGALQQQQTQKNASPKPADCNPFNFEHIRQHDRWYLQILDNLVLQARDYKASTGGVGSYFGMRETSSSEDRFWTFVLYLQDLARKVDVRKSLLTAYPFELKSRRGSSLWTETTFANLPHRSSNELGTYILETSSGYCFTGASYPAHHALFPFSPNHGLQFLEDRFNSLASCGFKNLLRPSLEMDKNTRFNLWLLRECSRPSVSYRRRALGFLPQSLVTE